MGNGFGVIVRFENRGCGGENVATRFDAGWRVIRFDPAIHFEALIRSKLRIDCACFVEDVGNEGLAGVAGVHTHDENEIKRFEVRKNFFELGRRVDCEACVHALIVYSVCQIVGIEPVVVVERRFNVKRKKIGP